MSDGDAAFERQDWQAAVDAYQKARAAGNDSGMLHFRMGFALHMLGRYDEALPSHLRAAGVTHPEIRIDGLYNAACACALTGNIDKALEYLQKAVDAGFKDTSQLEKDSDMNPLRDNERFKQIAAGIGVKPVLFEWMNFFVGTWEQRNSKGEILDTITFARPLEKSRVIVSTSTKIGGGQWTGLLWPDADARRWRWTSADSMGTMLELTGTPTDAGGMIFAGNDYSAAGKGANIRLTFMPQSDSRIREVAEISTDGTTWRTHHDEYYVAKTPGQPPATQ
jgi:tetratricopeptide (TPR) repeat protein